MTDIKKKIESRLLEVEKPARYIGGELNAVIKDFNNVKAHFGFAFPDTYEIGMSNLGMQILYKVLNDMEGVYCERTFAPSIDFEQIMREDYIPLFTIETKTPLKDLDILGFTLQYELSCSNVLNMLDLAQIPMRRTERENEFPFIVAGGPCVYNPEPMADIIDAFFIGEGEESMPKIMDAFLLWKKSGQPKIAFLKSIAQLEGVYVPAFYDITYDEKGLIAKVSKNFEKAPDRVCKCIVENLDEALYPEKMLVPFINIVHDRAMTEIFRGCTRGCRFCQAGMIYRPVRERSKERIQAIAKNQIKCTGYEELSILSLSTGDYSEIEPLTEGLMKMCKENEVALSLPSLRLDSFSFKVMNEIQGYKKSGLTFAPEAGTQRLRNIINKSITEDDIYGAARQAFSLGWDTIKLYFMIGLPYETYEDLDGIAVVAEKIVEIYKELHNQKSGRLSVNISVSNFGPKPHTPFQWHPQNTPEEFSQKHHHLKNKFKGKKNITFHYHESRTSFLEAVLAKGDRRIGEVLVEAVRLGCKFDGWGEHFDFSKWMQAFENCNVDPNFYATRTLNHEEILPWDMINCGVNKEFLLRENQKAMEGLITPDCKQNCESCGINEKYQCFVSS